MANRKHWNLVKLSPEEYVTNPIITRYEAAKVLATTVEYIYLTGEIHMDPSELYISTEEVPEDVKNKISRDDIYEIEGKPCIKLSGTTDIAKVMLNKGVSPLKIHREIGRDPNKMIIWVEEWDVNDLQKEIYVPFS